MDTTMETDRFRNFYIHLPYCETKCHYCDFFSLPESQTPEPDRMRVYDAICQELKLRADVLADSAETVFFGGGTPSLAPFETLATLASNLRLNASTEVTMEANPSSITLEKAKAWRSFGINRISMGVQALDDDRLKWLGRVHGVSQVFSALENLFEAGFRNVSIDYIVGVPGQEPSTIERELCDVLSRFPLIRHVSAYLLTLKNSNAKFKDLPSDEVQLSHLRAVSGVLGEQGFAHYEISNFARPNSRARHNENYWVGGGYLGIGPSAHSYWPTKRCRTKNWASLGKYRELIQQGASAVEWEEVLDEEQLRLEYLLLRLRRSEGIRLDEYTARFGRDLYADNRQWIDRYLEQGFCAVQDGRFQLSRDGFFLSDQILSNIT